MIAVSENFKTAMKQPIKELQAFVNYDGVGIRDEDDLISYKISGDGGLCRTVMKKIEIQHLGSHGLLGKWLTVGYSVKLPNGVFEPLEYGSFIATEVTESKDTDVISVVGYDKMFNAMTPYVPLSITYPVNLFTYAQELCKACDLELGNTEFKVNGDLIVERELFENIDGITYRDIFTQIAQATASIGIIGADDKLYFKELTDTSESLTYDNMFKLKLENFYGEINSVVLSRAPQEDNIFLKDDDSIAEYGLTEFRIENNEFLDKKRENAIIPIFNKLKGVGYYPFETNTEGLGWYEIGDNFTIIVVTKGGAEIELKTSLFNFTITVDGSLKETLKATAETQTQTQYQYAKSISKRVKNTEIIVNKQDGIIESIVSDVDGVKEDYTRIVQDVKQIVSSVQNSGGNNLIQNSVMFACDKEDKPIGWEVSGDGSLVIGSNTESVSRHGFTLSDMKVSQNIPVTIFDVDNPIYYSFSTKIKKSSAGSCYVKIYNNAGEEYIIPLNEGEEAYYNEYEKVKLEPKTNYYTIEFYASADSDATFTDNMFVVGEYKSQWTQANGEVMNTNVAINKDGITVKNVDEDGETTGDYTVVSTIEFAGYSKVDGVLKKVFSLNKSVTIITKLKAEDEIAMTPIKIVPITEGELQGWAFVPSTEV